MMSSTFLATSAAGYELQMGRWSRRLAPLLIEFAGVSNAARLLDVGCGTGSLTRTLANVPGVERVMGVDLSPAYVAHARQVNTDPRISFEVGDVCALPFEDGSFDAVYSSLALQFVPNFEAAIGEMRRITQPGGTIAAATWDTRGGMVIYRMFFDIASVLDSDAARRRAEACSRPMSTSEGLRKAWRAAGLMDVEVSNLSIRMEFSSFEDFWSPLDGRDGPYAEYLGTLEADAKSDFQTKLRSAYLDGEPDGLRSYVATAWSVKGRVP